MTNWRPHNGAYHATHYNGKQRIEYVVTMGNCSSAGTNWIAARLMYPAAADIAKESATFSDILGEEFDSDTAAMAACEFNSAK